MNARDEYAAIQRRFARAFGWTSAAFNDRARKLLRGDKSPAAWVQAAQAVTAPCGDCKGAGTYYWGACVNGVMSKSGPHYHCNGKGYVTDADLRRNWGYWNRAIAAAFAVSPRRDDDPDCDDRHEREAPAPRTGPVLAVTNLRPMSRVA